MIYNIIINSHSRERMFGALWPDPHVCVCAPATRAAHDAGAKAIPFMTSLKIDMRDIRGAFAAVGQVPRTNNNTQQTILLTNAND